MSRSRSRKRRQARAKRPTAPRRDPRLIHDPEDPLAPMVRRLAWTMIAAGTAAIAAGAALGMTVHIGFLGIGLLGGLAFALGVCGLAERKGITLPAFLVGLAAPFVLTFGGHSVLMDRIGHTETCTVQSSEEHRGRKYPSVDYVFGCPSGTTKLTLDWNDRLTKDDHRKDKADIRVGEPLLPMLAEPDLWNLALVMSVLLAMTAIVPIARSVRRQP